ncbi:MAG: hypothetical protein ACOYEV_09065 [Candidatus Nanopelagicales bacterium]
MIRRSGGDRWKPGVGLEALAGWLFADLLLVMFIVGLGAEITSLPAAEPSPTPTSTATDAATPTPSPTEAAMSQVPVLRTVKVDAGELLASGARGKQAKADLREELALTLAELTGRRAAMVLIWGHASTVGQGQEIAETVGEQLAKALPEIFGEAAQRALWKGDNKTGEVDLEIYLFQG